MTHTHPNDDRLLYLKTMVDAVEEATFVTENNAANDFGNRILFVNRAFVRQSGYSCAESCGRPPGLLFGPRTETAAIDYLKTAFRQSQQASVEFMNYRKDGDTFWAQLCVNPITVNGRCDHILAIQRPMSRSERPHPTPETTDADIKTLADGVDEAILIHRDRRPVFVNSAFMELFGFATFGQALQETSLLLNLAARQNLHRSAVSGGSNIDFSQDLIPLDVVRTDGRALKVHARTRPIRWQGQPASLVTLMPEPSSYRAPPRTLDLWGTSGKPVQQAKATYDAARLPKADHMIAPLIDALPIIVAYKDRDLIFRHVNQAYADWVGRPRDAIIGRHVSAFQDERHYQMMQPRRAAVFAGECVRYETTRDLAGHGLRDLTMSMVPHKGTAGDVVGYFTIVEDRTEQLGEALLNARRDEQLRLIMSEYPGLVSYRDRNLRFQFVNDTFEDWYGLPPEQVIGRRLSEVVSLTTFQAVKPYLDRVLAGEKVYFEQSKTYPRTGCRKVVTTFLPHKNETGQVLGFFSFSQDVTNLSEAQRNNLDAERRRRLEEQLTVEVLSSVGHAVRSPLNAMMGFAEMIRDGVYGPLGHERYHELIREVIAAGEQLLSTAGETLETASADAVQERLRKH